jgi:hypothetical protein
MAEPYESYKKYATNYVAQGRPGLNMKVNPISGHQIHANLVHLSPLPPVIRWIGADTWEWGIITQISLHFPHNCRDRPAVAA